MNEDDEQGGAAADRRHAQADVHRGKGYAPLSLRDSATLILTLLILIVVPAATVLWIATELDVSTRAFRPEIVLPIILIVGITTLLGLLFVGVALYRRFGLHDHEAALGLPPGSIQAIIALGLILIFAIIGVYLHGVAGEPPMRFTTGLTRAQVDALPADTITAINTRSDGRFDVQRAAANDTQDDLSQQLLTTISTLVVAVAGFYFGSKAVGQGAAAVAIRGRRRRRPGGGGAEGDGGAGEGVDEAATYGERSPVTAATVADVDTAIASAPLREETTDEPATAGVDIPEEAPERGEGETPARPDGDGEGREAGGGPG